MTWSYDSLVWRTSPLWLTAYLPIEASVIAEYLAIILRNRAEYRLILSRRGRRPSRLKSDDIPRD